MRAYRASARRERFLVEKPITVFGTFSTGAGNLCPCLRGSGPRSGCDISLILWINRIAARAPVTPVRVRDIKWDESLAKLPALSALVAGRRP